MLFLNENLGTSPSHRGYKIFKCSNCHHALFHLTVQLFNAALRSTKKRQIIQDLAITPNLIQYYDTLRCLKVSGLEYKMSQCLFYIYYLCKLETALMCSVHNHLKKNQSTPVNHTLIILSKNPHITGVLRMR